MTAPYWIDSNSPVNTFPAVDLALDEPNGLLAIGGDLSPQRLIKAYRSGIFPWFSDDQPILWWSPNPRAVLFPEHLKISHSLRKTLKRTQLEVSFDRGFEAVIQQCAAPRHYSDGTWITAEMHSAYVELHKMGIAHSVEVWQEDKLVGGLYGLAIGRLFFGESMFSKINNASKVAFIYLVRQLQSWDYALIDCQVSSAHLSSLGAVDIPRQQFTSLLNQFIDQPGHPYPWQFDEDFDPLSHE